MSPLSILFIPCLLIIHSILHFTHRITPQEHRYDHITPAMSGGRCHTPLHRPQRLDLAFSKRTCCSVKQGCLQSLPPHLSTPVCLLLLLQPPIFFPIYGLLNTCSSFQTQLRCWSLHELQRGLLCDSP